VRLLLDGRSDRTELVPGKALKLDVVLVDTKNRIHQLSKKQLSARSVYIKAINAQYDAEKMILTPNRPEDPDDSDISTTTVNYAVTVHFLGSTRDFRFNPDMAALYGPEPKAVKSMEVKLIREKGEQEVFYENMLGVTENSPQHPLLTPGKKIYLHVTVSDGKRTYVFHSLNPSFEYNLSVRRLKIHAPNFKWDRERDSLTSLHNEAVKQGQLYDIVISYRENEKISKSFRFTPDIEMVEGPDPTTVKEYNSQVGSGQTSATEIIPGQTLPLYIKVRDRYGRWLYNHTEGLNLQPHERERIIPAARYKVTSENLSYDPKTGKLSSDLQKASNMVAKTYQVITEYQQPVVKAESPDMPKIEDKKKSLQRGKTAKKPPNRKQRGRKPPKIEDEVTNKFKVIHELKPDFIGMVESHLTKRDKYDLKSIKGSDGAKVPNGQDGQNGHADQTGSRRADRGGDGTRGIDGVPGAPGEPGPAVTIRGIMATSLDGKKRYALYQLNVDEQPTQYIVIPADTKPIEISTRGGRGGKGGQGGNGGKGGDGGNGWLSGHAGNGGDGGGGGNGGQGGRGGKIQVYLSNKSLKGLLKLQSIPGPFGKEGPGGIGGAAGLPGSIVKPQGIEPTIARSRGSDGNKGTDGPAGKPGSPGKQGEISFTVQETKYILMDIKPPKEIQYALKPVGANWP
jgi:hypothetical protein